MENYDQDCDNLYILLLYVNNDMDFMDAHVILFPCPAGFMFSTGTKSDSWSVSKATWPPLRSTYSTERGLPQEAITEHFYGMDWSVTFRVCFVVPGSMDYRSKKGT